MAHEQAIDMLTKAGFPPTPEEKQFLTVTSQWPQACVEAASALYSTKLIAQSFERHAAALAKASEASETHSAALVKLAKASEGHAANLTRATWVLAVATIGLFITTAVLVWVTYRGPIGG